MTDEKDRANPGKYHEGPPDEETDELPEITPFTDADNPQKFEVQIRGRSYVLTKSELRGFLSSGMMALGHDGTKPWQIPDESDQ